MIVPNFGTSTAKDARAEVAQSPVEETAQPSVSASMAAELSQRDKTFFDRKFASISLRIPFDPNWSVAPHLFTELASSRFERLLPPAVMGISVDNAGRRMILVGTHFGPVVVYQRYPEGTNTIAYTAPNILIKTGLIRSTDRLSREDLEIILGGDEPHQNPDYNIGVAVSDLLDAFSAL